jgi:hypothetical protein
MKKRALVLAVLALACGTSVLAADRKPSRDDAPRRLGEALRTGEADLGTIATIVGWVLQAKEEDVAPGLAAALQAAFDGAGPAAKDPRAEAAAQGAIRFFVDVLDDARAHRRRDEAEMARRAWKTFAPIVRELER